MMNVDAGMLQGTCRSLDGVEMREIESIAG
jgi:hypothetical protein